MFFFDLLSVAKTQWLPRQWGRIGQATEVLKFFPWCHAFKSALPYTLDRVFFMESGTQNMNWANITSMLFSCAFFNSVYFSSSRLLRFLELVWQMESVLLPCCELCCIAVYFLGRLQVVTGILAVTGYSCCCFCFLERYCMFKKCM